MRQLSRELRRTRLSRVQPPPSVRFCGFPVRSSEPLSAKAHPLPNPLFSSRPLSGDEEKQGGTFGIRLDQHHRPAWNAGLKLEAKRPLKPKQVWEIRFWLEREERLRDRTLFNLATQILLGHTKIETMVRYWGVEVQDALALAEGTEV